MSTAEKLNLVSAEDYLDGELVSPVKHEYLAGVVYAMAGARNLHNIIATNVLAALHARLRGRPCRPFNSDTKIRIRLPTHVRFYYPDAVLHIVQRGNNRTPVFSASFRERVEARTGRRAGRLPTARPRTNGEPKSRV